MNTFQFVDIKSCKKVASVTSDPCEFVVSEEYGSGIVQSECFDAINFKFQALSKINDDISYVSTEFEKHKRHSQVLFMALESLLTIAWSEMYPT